MLFVTKKELQRELRELYQEITEQVALKKLITEMLAKDERGLEGVIKSAVVEYCQAHDAKIIPHAVMSAAGEDAIGQLIDDDLGLEKIHELVAEKIASRLLGEGDLKTELMAEVSAQVADSVWEDFCFDDFYPVIGEKCLELLRK